MFGYGDYSEEEIEIVRTDFVGKVFATHTAIVLNALPSNIARSVTRNAKAVFRIRGRLRLNRHASTDTEVHDEVRGRESDAAFCVALNNAIRRGREHAHIGVRKDDTPFTGRWIHAEPMFSGCSSSSAMCVEAADLDPVGDSLLV